MMAAAEQSVGCECGEWSGERCGYESTGWGCWRVGRVVVEWMPEWRRSTHVAAGNRGRYPANGSRRSLVAIECADRMLELDGDWCEVIEESDTRNSVSG